MNWRIFLFFLKKIIPPDEDNEVENCMAKYLGHVTYFDKSWSFRINTGHVTHQGKQNWPIEGCAILCTHLSLYEIIYDIIHIEILYISKDN